uniref:Uncharacterized protein n=1 Tax=Periophthalmus magnuspinnatus TaxID=409849 RepID=A0A3B3ZN33_9GOBI
NLATFENANLKSLAALYIQTCVDFVYLCIFVARRHLLTEDVIKLQEFQQKKLAVAHLITRSEGNFIELFNKKLQRSELILQDELKLLLHLCQSPDDMVVARDAIYRTINRTGALGNYLCPCLCPALNQTVSYRLNKT